MKSVDVQNLARRLIAAEASARAPSATGPGADAVLGAGAAQVCEKLRGPLSRLAGIAGFATLLSRALALAKRRVPALEAWRVRPDGALEKISNGEAAPHAATAGEHNIDPGLVLVSEMLGLLVTFIGGTLTLRLVRDIWPDIDKKAIRSKDEAGL
ncbi:MAG TPA: hypothetical protein VF171_02410 [Trueperaceae bacterium]